MSAATPTGDVEADAPQALVDAARQAMNDPGAFTKREHWRDEPGDYESMKAWQSRALRLALAAALRDAPQPWTAPLDALRDGRVHPGLPPRPDPAPQPSGGALTEEETSLQAALAKAMGCKRVPEVGALANPHYDYCERHPRSAGFGDWDRHNGGCQEALRLARAARAAQRDPQPSEAARVVAFLRAWAIGKESTRQGNAARDVIDALAAQPSAPVQTAVEAAQLLVDAERDRQRRRWGVQHDREHGQMALNRAARAYETENAALWPWNAQSWRPLDPMRNRVRAAALYQAAADSISLRLATADTARAALENRERCERRIAVMLAALAQDREAGR